MNVEQVSMNICTVFTVNPLLKEDPSPASVELWISTVCSGLLDLMLRLGFFLLESAYHERFVGRSRTFQRDLFRGNGRGEKHFLLGDDLLKHG